MTSTVVQGAVQSRGDLDALTCGTALGGDRFAADFSVRDRAR